MCWQAVELRAYEKRRQEQAFRSEHLLLRSKLVQTQGHGRWADLLGQFRAAVLVINRLKGETALREYNSPVEHYQVEREDGVSLTVDYDSELYRVTYSISVRGMNDRSFDLEVRDVNGNDKTVWVERQTGLHPNDQEIVKTAICDLLHAKE